MLNRILISVAALLALGGVAAAQGFGDTQTTFRNGVVYDDDLVPGRGLNSSFDAGDALQTGYGSNYSSYDAVQQERREASPDLIGADGRLRDR